MQLHIVMDNRRQTVKCSSKNAAQANKGWLQNRDLDLNVKLKFYHCAHNFIPFTTTWQPFHSRMENGE